MMAIIIEKIVEFFWKDKNNMISSTKRKTILFEKPNFWLKEQRYNSHPRNKTRHWTFSLKFDATTSKTHS